MKTKCGFLIIAVFVVLYVSGVSPLYAEKITGRVVDTSNDPVIGASVQVFYDSLETCEMPGKMNAQNIGCSTGFDGYYFILGIRPGVYCLRMSNIGYLTKIKRVVVAKDSTARCDFITFEMPMECNITPQGIENVENCILIWGKGGTWNRELTEWTNTYPRLKGIRSQNKKYLPFFFQPQNIIRISFDSSRAKMTATMPLLADEVNPVIVKVSEEGGLVTSLRQDNLYGEDNIYLLEFMKQDSLFELAQLWKKVNSVVDTIRAKKQNLVFSTNDRFQLPDSSVKFNVF